MKKASASDRLDVRAFARAGDQLTRNEPLACYPRILEEAAREPEGDVVAWKARGELRTGSDASEQVWLHVEAQARVPFICQRCLGVVDLPLQVDRWFRFVEDEATAAAQDDDSEEDLLVLAPEFDLQQLVEDELVLAVPMIVRHETCPGQAAAPSEEFGIAVAGRPNPFAVLADFKPSKKSPSR